MGTVKRAVGRTFPGIADDLEMAVVVIVAFSLTTGRVSGGSASVPLTSAALRAARHHCPSRLRFFNLALR